MKYASVALAMAGLFVTVAALAPAPAVAQAAQQNPASTALAALFKKSDEDNLRRNPVNALSRGDLRYAGELGDYASDAYYEAERQAARQELAALARIDRKALTPDEQIAYDVFKWQRALDLEGLQGAIFEATVVRPVDHFNGFHTFFAELSSGEGYAPYKTLADYESGLKRFDGYVRVSDGNIARMEQGLKAGIVQPKIVMVNVLEQLNAMLADNVEGSAFYRPVSKFPDGISAADQARLKAAYAQAISAKMRPALTRMRDFIRDRYLPAARDSVGCTICTAA